MKNVILIALTLLFAPLAYAESSISSLTDLQKRAEAYVRSGHQFRADKVWAPVIRQSLLKAKIVKSVFVKLPNGGFRVDRNEVCHLEVMINFYDATQHEVNFADWDSIRCQSTLEGKNVEIKLGALAMLTQFEAIDPGKTLVKAFVPMMWIDAPSNDIGSNWLSSSGATKDLNAKSFIYGLEPHVVASCSTTQPSQTENSTQPSKRGSSTQDCTSTANESFSAIVEIED